MKRVFLLFFILALFFTESSSQSIQTDKVKFYQAEGFVLYEEYKDALPLYKELLATQPDNANFKYRIGQCLINIPGSKKEAIGYLEDAVKNINLKYKEGRFKETKAPYDAYYFLANAYRINNQLSKALDTYELFKKNLDPEVYRPDIVNLQIESCRNAQELMKIPNYIRKENLGELINSRFSESNAIISGDESILVYNVAAQLQDFIFFSKKVNGKWTAPVNIISDFGLGFEYKNFATSLSDDGKELYIYRPGDDYDGNIYVTLRDKNDRWSNLVKLNTNINTKYWESHATISHNGKKLYFTSNRKGTYGLLDIWVSERDSIFDWGPAKNLGPEINSIYNEESPFLGKDDKTLFFSSAGNFNIGGYDIFYSTLLENGDWSAPLNVGYPLNTTDDDLFFNPVNDGYQAYYAIDDSGSYGLLDIYRIEIFSKEHPRKFFVRGIVQVKDLQKMFKDSVKVSAINNENPNASVIVYSNPVTGEYKFELSQGRYEFTFEADRAEKTSKNFDLPLTNPVDSFVLPGTTLQKTDFIADMVIASNKTLSVANADTIKFPIKVEPKSLLLVEHWLGDSLLISDKFIINDSSIVYKSIPRTGENRLSFKLTDKFSNTTSTDIFIKREKEVIEQPVEKPDYKRVIAQRQINAFVILLKNRAEDNLKKIIQLSGMEKNRYGKVDDIISFLKEEAAKSSIKPVAVEKPALKVAVMDNVLTQEAVDLIARKTIGQLHEIMNTIDIYNSDLKTWTDLQQYISAKSNGKIQPDDLNNIAADILSDTDTFIAKVREKILTYSNSYTKGSVIKQSLNNTDQKKIKNGGLWMQEVYNESITAKIKDSEMARMISILSALPGTGVEKYLEELAVYSDEVFNNYLIGTDLKKAGIKTPNDFILYLLKNRSKGLFPETSMFDALARLIAAKDISPETIASQTLIPEGNNIWLLWMVFGAGLFIFFIVFTRRKMKDKK